MFLSSGYLAAQNMLDKFCIIASAKSTFSENTCTCVEKNKDYSMKQKRTTVICMMILNRILKDNTPELSCLMIK